MTDAPSRSPLIVALAVVALGLVYLALGAAPPHYLAINAGAAAIGLMTLGAIRYTPVMAPAGIGSLAALLAGAVFATAVFGASVDGATRWVHVGALSLQPALALLAPVALLFLRQRDPVTTAAMLASAAAVAMMPDRQMAGALLAASAAGALLLRDRWTIIAMAGSAVAFGIAIARPDTLEAKPFVEQILWRGFATHPLGGTAIWAGVLLMPLPGLIAARRSGERPAAGMAFAAFWIAAMLAAALGAYPTPIVGFGGSAVLGYLLCLPLLRDRPVAAARGANGSGARANRSGPPLERRSALFG